RWLELFQHRLIRCRRIGSAGVVCGRAGNDVSDRDRDMADDAQKHYEAKRKPLNQQQLTAALVSHARYLGSQGGVRAQLAHHNLDGLNLANRNLTEADFTGCSLIGANLSGSNLDRASLYCAD